MGHVTDVTCLFDGIWNREQICLSLLHFVLGLQMQVLESY